MNSGTPSKPSRKKMSVTALKMRNGGAPAPTWLTNLS